MPNLIDEIRAEQRAHWQAGQRVPIRTLLDRHPEIRDDEDSAVDLIYSEILLREELGEQVAWTEYFQLFPEYADKLRRQRAFHEIMRGGLSSPDAQATVLPADQSPLDDDSNPPAEPDAPLFPVVPGYEIQDVLGEGALAVVYLARQLSLGKLVALKMLRDPDLVKPDAIKLLRRDAEVLAKLEHPNIVRVIDFVEFGGRSFFSMEYVNGRSLAERLKAGPLRPREAVQLVETMARALHAVHEKGIVHRDLKPANILLDENSIPKVADFGLAKRLDADASLAASGQLVGNIAHMAPEQAEGKTNIVGPSADIWALGVILYELLSGRLPFTGKSVLETLERIRTGDPASLLRAGADRDLEAICQKCLEKKPWHRYATTADLADELGRFLRDDPRDPVRTRRRSLPVRGWRIARRHPIRATALALIILALPSIPLIHIWTDADRPVSRLENDLASGHAVTLIGKKGRPKWFRLRTGADATQVSEAPDGTFSVHTWGFCLVDLLRTAGWPTYKICAEIRHEKSKSLGEVGLFFGLEEIPTEQGTLLSFGQVMFDDVNSEADISRLRPPGLPGPIPEPQGNAIYFEPFLYSLLSDGTERTQRLNTGSPDFRFEPFKNGNEWRTITIFVGDSEIVASWADGKKIGRITVDHWNLFLAEGLEHDRLVHRSKPATFVRNGALGLCVTQGAASFRNIVVEPTSIDLTLPLENMDHAESSQSH
jgi:serine/threonine-protein kinase